MLNAAPDKELPRKAFHSGLLTEFPARSAEHQLDIAIGWGRYAELLDYDNRGERLSLDVSDGKAAPIPT